jgi:hypothetical protein
LSKVLIAAILLLMQSAPPIAVSVSPDNAEVAKGQQQLYTATVANDPTNSGVTWTLKDENGNPCSPGCGTLTMVTPFTAVYTAPNAPDPPTDLKVIVI